MASGSLDIEFPLLCESCLGSNPYVKMQHTPLGGTCKMCAKPYKLFKWRPGRGESYRKTEVCRTCASMKDICQTCILDLRYGLPSQLRDDVMAYAESSDKTSTKIHESDVTRDYKMQEFLRDPAIGISNRVETGDKMIRMIRAANDQRHQNCSLSARSQVRTTETSDSSDGRRLEPLYEDSFCGAEMVSSSQSVPQVTSVAETLQSLTSTRKRKQSSKILPPRPPGPPPSWAFETKAQIERSASNPIIESADLCVTLLEHL